jgi:hypothetical protein
MEFLPEQNQFLEEVKSGNLISNNEYLIEFTGYDNVNVKEKGTFVGSEGAGAFSKFILPSRGNMTVPFQNSRSRFYRPRTQEILDNQAQRQYVAKETKRLINQKTGRSIGKKIVDDFNNATHSGGKRMKKQKNKTRHRKGKQTRHRKRKQSRRMK